MRFLARRQPRATLSAILRSLALLLATCVVGCHAGSWDGTSCQSMAQGGTRCYDLTSMKQQPGGPPTPADEGRSFADDRPPNPPPGPVMAPPPSGVYAWPTNVYVVTPGPVQPPPPRR